MLEIGRLLEADAIIVGNIALAERDSIRERFADAMRGAGAWHRVEMSAINVADGAVISTSARTYDSRLRRLARTARRLVREI